MRTPKSILPNSSYRKKENVDSVSPPTSSNELLKTKSYRDIRIPEEISYVYKSRGTVESDKLRKHYSNMGSPTGAGFVSALNHRNKARDYLKKRIN